ncbi:MAG TPA: peptidoglycan-associated lipoprotein Pal [Terracidiphilus sp.]
MNRLNRIVAPTVLLVALLVAGCGTKTKPVSREETAPASVPAPTAQLTATPALVSANDQVQLSWRTTNAFTISIDGIGDVPSSGVKTVTPSASTTYHLVAKGDGGTAEATARVTVNGPPAVLVPNSLMSAEEQFKSNVQDIFFDYDAYDIRGDAQATLSRNASYLVSHPEVKILIGGYCDERGSNEYNLALGQNRADATKNALVTAGVAANRIRTVSLGKEKPFCSESTEECWQQNRRGGFTPEQ